MNKIDIYTKGYCSFCMRAKSLLEAKGASYNNIQIDRNPELRAGMIERAEGNSTVPQIFIGDTYVGGCDELYALESAGKLDALLAN